MASRLKLSIPLPDFLHTRRRAQSYDVRSCSHDESRSRSQSRPRHSHPDPQQQQQQQPPQQYHHQPLLPSTPEIEVVELDFDPDAAVAAAEASRSPSRLGSVRAANDFLLGTILRQDRWRAHGDLIRVDCPHTLAELHALGHLPRADGLAACRRLVRAPVIHDEVAQYLWAALSASARGPELEARGRGAGGGCGGGGVGVMEEEEEEDDQEDDEYEGARADGAPVMHGAEEADKARVRAQQRRALRRRATDEAFLAHLDARFRFDRPASASARDRRRRDSPPASPRDTRQRQQQQQQHQQRRSSSQAPGTGPRSWAAFSRRGTRVDSRDEASATTRGRIPSRSGRQRKSSAAAGAEGRPAASRSESQSSMSQLRSASLAGMLGSIVEGLGKGVVGAMLGESSSQSDRGRLPRSL